VLPIDRPLTITQGTDWTWPFNVVDDDGNALNLTGATLEMQIRTEAFGSVILEPTVSIATAASGIAQATLTAAATDAVGYYPAGGVYDVKVTTSGGTVYTAYAGGVAFRQQITRT
jgi:hypothetical protein